MTFGDPRRKKELVTLMQRLGLGEALPLDWALLHQALVHPSMASDRNYEQLEFLGDGVIRLVATELLWELNRDAPVGELAAIRSALVSDRTLAQIADRYNLDRFLIMSPGTAANPEAQISRRADAFEALLGALYLSGDRTHRYIRSWLDPQLLQEIEAIRSDPAFHNYKEALQEWTQAHYRQLPEYRVNKQLTRSPQDDRFVAEVWFQGQCWGKGTGRSKKQAEQRAAKQAFQQIQPSPP